FSAVMRGVSAGLSALSWAERPNLWAEQGPSRAPLVQASAREDTTLEQRVDADPSSTEEGDHERKDTEGQVQLVAALATRCVDPIRPGHRDDRNHHVAEDRRACEACQEAERERNSAEEFDRASECGEHDAGRESDGVREVIG